MAWIWAKAADSLQLAHHTKDPDVLLEGLHWRAGSSLPRLLHFRALHPVESTHTATASQSWWPKSSCSPVQTQGQAGPSLPAAREHQMPTQPPLHPAQSPQHQEGTNPGPPAAACWEELSLQRTGEGQRAVVGQTGANVLPFALSTAAVGLGPRAVPGVPEQGQAQSPVGEWLGREAAGNVDPVDLLWVISPDYFTAAC